MLSESENDILCRVGPGTLMGDLMREYWIPALMPSELATPDSPPMRLRLLGENLIAFRDTSGRRIFAIAEQLASTPLVRTEMAPGAVITGLPVRVQDVVRRPA